MILLVFLKLGITLAIFYGFINLGWKGILGFVLGMGLMVVILFTNNPIAMMFIRMFSGRMSIHKILKGEIDDEKEKDYSEDYIEVGRE